MGLGLRWPMLCGVCPVSEMTYTVSNGTLNSTIPYHCQLNDSINILAVFNDNYWQYIKQLFTIHCVQKKSESSKDFATTCVNLHVIKYNFTHTQPHLFQMVFWSFWKITVTQVQKSNCKQNHSKIILRSAAAVNLETEQPQYLKLMLKMSSIFTDTPLQSLPPLIDLYQWCRDQSGTIHQLVVLSNGRPQIRQR